MTLADRERARKLARGIIIWIVLAPAALVALVVLLFIVLLWHAGNIRAQEAPQVVIICQLSKTPILGDERIRLFRARSHAHCYNAVDNKNYSRAYPTTLTIPGDSGRLLALCGKDLADCPELP